MTSNNYGRRPSNTNGYEHTNSYNSNRRYSNSGSDYGNVNSTTPLYAPSPQRPGLQPDLLTPEDAFAPRESSCAQRYTPVQYQQTAEQTMNDGNYASSPLNPYRPRNHHHAASFSSQPPPELHYPPPRRQHSHPSKYHRRGCACDCDCCCYYESEPESEFESSAARRRANSRKRSRRNNSAGRRPSEKMERSKPLSKKDVIKNYVFGTPIENYG